MRIAPMRIALALLLVASSGCMGMQSSYPAASASAAPASALVGIWRVTAVNGQPLPAASPMESNVTVDRSSLMLQANHNYALSITAHSGSEAPREVNQSGTWSASGNVLTLNASTSRVTRFTYILSANALTLREDAVTYTLERS